jgi:hypothetical protein
MADPTYGGYTKGDLAKWGDSAASGNETYNSAKLTYESALKDYNAGKDRYGAGRAVFEGGTYGEDYGPYWSGNALSDPTLAELRRALDESQAAGEHTRSNREMQFRAKVAAFSTLVAFAGPWFGAAIYVASEAFIWLGKTFFSGSDGNSAKDRDAAMAAVKDLWDRWRIAPPTFASDTMSAASYTTYVRKVIELLDASDSAPWREAWIEVVDNALKLIEAKKSDLVRDAALAGMIPTTIEKWAIPYYTANTNGVKWGARDPRGKDKYGNDQSAATLDLDVVLKQSDPQAAGIAVMVAAYTGKRFEPLIESAVKSNRMLAESYGAYYVAQYLRLRDVFIRTMNAAGTTPERKVLLKLNPRGLLNRSPTDESAGKGTTALVAAGASAVGFLMFGPIGLAAGLASFLLMDDK